MNDELTFKQRRFAEEFVVDQNGTQAALRAGYSKSSAAVSASRLLRNDKVRALISTHMARLSEEVDARAVETYRKLKKIAFQSIADYWDKTDERNFSFRPLDQLTEDERVCIKQVKMRGDELSDIIFENKVQALGRLLELGLAQRAVDASTRSASTGGLRDG